MLATRNALLLLLVLVSPTATAAQADVLDNCTAQNVHIEGLLSHAAVTNCEEYIEYSNAHSKYCNESLAVCAGFRLATIQVNRNDTHFYICPNGVCNHSLTTDCSTINFNSGGGITTNSTELACIVPADSHYQKCSLVLRPKSCNGHEIPSSDDTEVIYSLTDDGKMNMTRVVGNISWQSLFERMTESDPPSKPEGPDLTPKYHFHRAAGEMNDPK